MTIALGLRQRKIKITQGQAPANCWVWQDGSAADVDATYKYDDGIITGAPTRGSALYLNREYLELSTLENDYEAGRSATGRLVGRRAWFNDPMGSMQVEPNSRVEIFAEVPTAHAVTMPAWHLNTQTAGTQVRIFYGHVQSVSVRDFGLAWVARDPRWKANNIKLVRSAPDGVVVPKIAFNLPVDAPDHVYNCIKVISGTTLGIGTSTLADSRATLGQILKYLRQHYNAQLIAQEVLDPAYSGLLFTDADCALLTWKPGPIVYQDIGFAEAVKRILEDWAPHLKIMVDPRTTQWRLVPVAPAISPSFATCYRVFPAGGPALSSADTVSDTSLFSATPGAPGNRVRIYWNANPSINEERTVYSIVGSNVNFVEQGLHIYPNAPPAPGGASLYPVLLDALPNLILGMDDTPPGGIEVDLDLDGVWSAVNLYSVFQKTSTSSATWEQGSAADTFGLTPGHDSAFESVWTDKDSDRTCDFGPPGQVGMKPYRLGNDGTNDYLEISYGQSQYGSAHANNEWKDCSLWVWSQNGANCRNLKIGYTIKSHAHVADVGDGTPGMRIKLNIGVGGFLGLAANFKTIADPGSVEDIVVLTQDYGQLPLTTTGNNKKWEVGRKWYFTDTTIQFDASSSPHVSVCSPVKFMQDNGTQTSRRSMGMNPGLGYPTVNQSTKGPWETLATGGLGAFHVWRRATYTRQPTGSPCAQGGWTPPKLVQVDFEKTETTLRNARFPTTGYAGIAFARYNHQAEYTQAMATWTEDGQTSDYTTLAEKLWEKKQNAHNKGTITKRGIRANAAWIDLGVRISLHSTQSGAIYGGPAGGNVPSGSMMEGFYGALTSFVIDFPSNTVKYGFDNQPSFQDLAAEVYEKLGIKVANVVADIKAVSSKLEQLQQCAGGSFSGESPQSVCGERVYFNDKTTINKKISVIGKPQQDGGSGQGSAGYKA